jgi:hypothetical protein
MQMGRPCLQIQHAKPFIVPQYDCCEFVGIWSTLFAPGRQTDAIPDASYTR